MVSQPGLPARGPWESSQVEASWHAEQFDAKPEVSKAADAVVDSLRRRGWPSHDGLAVRLVSCQAGADRLSLELQPAHADEPLRRTGAFLR